MHAAATMCSSEGSECIHATMKQLKEGLLVTSVVCHLHACYPWDNEASEGSNDCPCGNETSEGSE